MGTSQKEATETERLTNLATNEERTPESRILSARALLRHTQFADRSCRVAKKLAKAYMENLDASATVRAKAARLWMFAVEKKIDEVEEAAEKQAEAEVAQAATDPSLPKDFNRPYFNRLIMECSTDHAAQQKEYDALVAEAHAKYDPTQPTYVKVEKDGKSWLECTPYYRKATAEHSAALKVVEAKYEVKYVRSY
jgi:hypothetical protein